MREMERRNRAGEGRKATCRFDFFVTPEDRDKAMKLCDFYHLTRADLLRKLIREAYEKV